MTNERFVFIQFLLIDVLFFLQSKSIQLKFLFKIFPKFFFFSFFKSDYIINTFRPPATKISQKIFKTAQITGYSNWVDDSLDVKW